MNGSSLNLHKKDHTFKKVILSKTNLDCLGLGSEESQCQVLGQGGELLGNGTAWVALRSGVLVSDRTWL